MQCTKQYLSLTFSTSASVVASKTIVYFGFEDTSSNILIPVSMMVSVAPSNVVSEGNSYNSFGTAAVTVTAHAADLVPAVAVIVVFPAASAITVLLLMLTMSAGEDDQTTESVLFAGVTVAVRAAVSPCSNESVDADREMFVAGIVSVMTVSAVFVPTTSPLQGSNATVRVPLPASVKDSL